MKKLWLGLALISTNVWADRLVLQPHSLGAGLYTIDQINLSGNGLQFPGEIPHAEWLSGTLTLRPTSPTTIAGNAGISATYHSFGPTDFACAGASRWTVKGDGSLLKWCDENGDWTALVDDDDLVTAIGSLATSSSLALKSDKAPFVSVSTVTAHGISATATDAVTNLATNYNLATGVLGLADALNTANTAQNALGVKYNDLSQKYNVLLTKVNELVSNTTSLRAAGGGL